MTNPTYNIERIKPENSEEEVMIKITIGDQSLLLTEDQAFEFSDIIEGHASMGDFEDHVDHALNGWGSPNWTDGSTC
jgi:hypothetical protein